MKLAVPARVRGAIAWRLHRLFGDRLVYGTLLIAAKYWRSAMRNTVHIAVVGSAGKTTAKELMLGMLAGSGRGVGNPGSFNNIEEIAMAMLRVRPWHKHFVTELSEDRPGMMERTLGLLRPRIGIVTVVRDDHLSAYASRDALAQEISKLVSALPANGTAVLNVDDERVAHMASACIANVITVGTSPHALLRAEDISSNWPNRLQLTLAAGTDRVRLQTQLCGTHWLPSVLGAIGGGLAMGLTLAECAVGIATVAPFEGRMQPVTTADGVTFIRDDFKAPLWSLDSGFEFMESAIAARKIIVIGEISDIASQKALRYAKVTSRALEVADIVIVVGPWATSALKAKRPGAKGALSVFTEVRDAAAFVNATACPGDLILLKGTAKQDHLLRIILARRQEVACWRDDCKRMLFCDRCPDRLTPSGAPPEIQTAAALQMPSPFVAYQDPPAHAMEHVIVGLGNPGPQYVGTPHNVGRQVVDQLAASLQMVWDQQPGASIARGRYQGQPVCLVKVELAMNLIGGGLKSLAGRMAFGAEQCVLVFDDMNLPLGTVKSRLSGSAGGHRGVASILEAFQTSAFRRVKVGVAPAGAAVNRLEYVLRPFDLASQAIMTKAISNSAARVLQMLSDSETQQSIKVTTVSS